MVKGSLPSISIILLNSSSPKPSESGERERNTGVTTWRGERERDGRHFERGELGLLTEGGAF